MSAQNSSGIQTLLEAERKAHDVVQNARACMFIHLSIN